MCESHCVARSKRRGGRWGTLRAAWRRWPSDTTSRTGATWWRRRSTTKPGRGSSTRTFRTWTNVRDAEGPRRLHYTLVAFFSLFCHFTSILTLGLSAPQPRRSPSRTSGSRSSRSNLSRSAPAATWRSLGLRCLPWRPSPAPSRPKGWGASNTNTHRRHGWDTCGYRAALLCRQVEPRCLFVSTETNPGVKLRLKALRRAPRQQDRERCAVPVSRLLNQAAMTSRVQVYNVAFVFPRQAARREWITARWIMAASTLVLFYSASLWGNCSLWMWRQHIGRNVVADIYVNTLQTVVVLYSVIDGSRIILSFITAGFRFFFCRNIWFSGTISIPVVSVFVHSQQDADVH